MRSLAAGGRPDRSTRSGVQCRRLRRIACALADRFWGDAGSSRRRRRARRGPRRPRTGSRCSSGDRDGAVQFAIPGPRRPAAVHPVNRPRIFVSIPSYRDRECQWTLRDMFERARHPERVFAGVCWQTVPDQDQDCFLLRPCPTQVRTIEFHALQARGLGWARAKAQSLWQGEEYSLQIDSHMRFADDWDEQMLDLLSACDAPDPVLTVYP